MKCSICEKKFSFLKGYEVNGKSMCTECYKNIEKMKGIKQDKQECLEKKETKIKESKRYDWVDKNITSWVDKNKRIFAWIYDVGFIVILFSIVFSIINFEKFWFMGSVSFIYWIIIMLSCWIFNIYYEYKEKSNTSWVFLIFFFQIVGVPLYYFMKLRPHWTGKKKSVYF